MKRIIVKFNKDKFDKLISSLVHDDFSEHNGMYDMKNKQAAFVKAWLKMYNSFLDVEVRICPEK